MFAKQKRAFKRIDTHHLIKYKSAAGDGSLIVSFARNLSAGGVLLYSQIQPVLGDTIELAINFPGIEQPVIVKGKILRSKELKKIGGYEMAIEFIDLGKQARESMEKKINISIDQAKRGKQRSRLSKRER